MTATQQHFPMMKNQQSDVFTGWTLLRTITAADYGAAVTSFTPNFLDAHAAYTAPVNKARHIHWRVFSNASGGTCSIQWISQSPSGPKKKSGGESPTISMPTTILATVCTTSGSSYEGFNPVTGEADAGVTWYEMSNHTPVSAAYCDSRITEYPTSAATGYHKFFQFDCIGDDKIVPICYGAPGSNATKFLVAYKVVE